MNKRLDGENIIYPKFTREENHACKLSDSQIREIQGLFKLQRRNFHTDREIYEVLAKRYNVHYQTIHYWCKNEYRKMVLRHSAVRVAREWRTNPDLVKARIRKLKADWKKRKNVKLLREYTNKRTRSWYKAREEFIDQHREEFNKFLSDNYTKTNKGRHNKQ